MRQYGRYSTVSRWGIFISVFVAVAAAAANGQTRNSGRVFAASRASIDEILKRPYSPDVPMGCVGARLWASSPQGWGFGDDVHWLYLTNLCAFDLEIRDAHGLLSPARSQYCPSRIQMSGTTRSMKASASFTYRMDHVANPLTAPFRPERRWTCWSSKSREDWYSVDFGNSKTLRGIKLFFYDDRPHGGVRPPQSVRIERREGGEWKEIKTSEAFPPIPGPGENRFLFGATEVERLRLVFRHAGEDFYTGLYGFEVIEDNAGEKTASEDSILQVTADKWITSDDCLMSVVRLSNPSNAEAKIQFCAKAPMVFPPNEPCEAVLLRGDGGRATLAANPASVELHGQDVKVAFYVVAENFGSSRLNKSEPGSPTIECTIDPGRTASIYVGMSFADSHDAARRVALRWLRGQSQVNAQIQENQRWYDDNTAFFACSDPMVEKMYYHRCYLQRKNLLDPGLGKMHYKALAEGRWRSGWYPNVISYGAGHQIRETRWFRDRTIWSGQLRTFIDNLKRNGVTPAHVKPSGPSDSQYTDWIASTAWDGYLVHPDRALLNEIAEGLAANVRGWQATYDPDGDGLLWVDSHWWTGMEWQPSFFSFCDFETDPKDRMQPRKREKLDRVDLTVYNYGNALNVAKVFRELGKIEKAKQFEALAEKIRGAVLKCMWDDRDGFFYSLRASDHAKADVKEIIGIYPFYFNLPPVGQGYERAWLPIIDPNEFWTPWPVASTSKKCRAYSQDRWPTGPGGSGCMWNGPTWPHANSIVLTAMANTLRGYAAPLPISKRTFWELFYSFTKAQFLDQNIEMPWTGEFYHGETGKWKTAERDYNHSTWLDILIPEIVGIRPSNDDTLVIDSILDDDKLDYFILDGQHYRGRLVTVVWDSPRGGADRFGDGRHGLDVYVDGKLAASSPSLSRLEIPLQRISR